MSKRPQQQAFAFTNWGGKRRGAGRKPKGDVAGMPHAKRPRFKRSEPVHVTIKLERGLPSLRAAAAFRAARSALSAGSERFGFRLVHWSVQSNHAHLIVEVDNERALSRGMKGLCVRIARAVNELWKRSGQVFADRFHARALRTPTEVRNALRYVLRNIEKHGLSLVNGIDPCSSSAWFDGWAPSRRLTSAVSSSGAAAESIFGRARTWLLAKGWRKRGLIGLEEVPASP